MTIKTISPQNAQKLLGEGAVLVDIRSADEYAREHITHAQHIALETITSGGAEFSNAAAVIFHCRSGNRTRMNAAVLESCASCDTYLLDGGLDAWKRAGLPVITDKKQPLELQRQVQIGAGSLALGGTLLGALISPWFYLIPGLVGAGLIVAGVTGFCGLARLLMHAPWNRGTAQQ